jgi:signal transduction histidine kinase
MALLADQRVIASSRPGEIGQQPAQLASHALRKRLLLPNSAVCQRCHPESTASLGHLVIDYPKALQQKPLQADRQALIGHGVLVLLLMSVICLLIVWFVVQQPLSRLTKAVARIRAGDFETDCELDNRDELGQLADALTLMQRSLREKDTELHELHQSQMARVDRLASVGQLASGLAHDIKNPLHSIGAALEVLARRNGEAKGNGVMGAIREQLAGVIKITDDMLRYARPSRPCFETCDVPELINKTIVLLTPQQAKKAVRIEMAPNNVLPIQADPNKLQQALLNLLLNAVQASADGAVVRVFVEDDAQHDAQEDRVIIRIQDEGSGIDPETAKRIFEPFYTTKRDGTGLGLAMTQTIVEQHCGCISLLDNGEHGACFQVSLPRTCQTATSAQAATMHLPSPEVC